ncbi:MAG: metal-sulfur cluster assembly factor [Arcobacteraceae bacterium]|nr:metal-sulfur cluster assembly factor [Arcobacteraceae bacterium]
MTTKEEVLQQISTIIDPEVGYNLVDLGLIYEVDISDDGTMVIVTMTLSTRGCPLHQMMVEWVEAAVLRCEGVIKCMVQVVWEPAWTIEKSAPHVQKALSSWM